MSSDDPFSKARHDLRTPVNQIIGYSELLQEVAEEEGLKHLVPDLQKIQSAARKQLEQIEQYLAPPKAGATPAPAAAAPTAPPAAIAAAEPPPVERPLDVRPPAPTEEKGGRILVVDDNEMNRDMLSRRLKARGFTAAVAEDGYEALKTIEAGRFDLLLLDIMMPGMSGIDVLKTLRQKYTMADLPIIMATAKDASEDVVEALKLGANDYVVKPLDFPVVLARVQTQLALKRQKDQIQRLAEDLDKRNRFIRNTFGRYLSDEVVSGLLESPEGLKLGGEKRTVTIMMSDLRAFTSVSERLGPEEVVRMLNGYLGVMAEIITKYHGTIDEFIGDAILTIFGAPVVRGDDAQRAVACAVAMQVAMDAVNAVNEKEGLPRLEMGIAVHTGEVVVGNIGSQRRTKYAVVGPPVNLAGRIESYTVGGQILASDATIRECGELVKVGERIEVKAKGAAEPIIVHEVRGIGGEYNVFLPEAQEVFVTLLEAAPLRYSVLEGKSVGDDVFEGALLQLSVHGGMIRSVPQLSPHTNIKIRLVRPDGREVPGDLYAKVIEGGAPTEGRFHLRFTSTPPEVHGYLGHLREAAAVSKH